MTALQVSGTTEARRYLREIADEMVLLFPITMDEAIGRINQYLSGRQFNTSVSVSVLLHEEQDVWAKHVYYGRDSFWWLGEDGLAAQPFDPS